MVFEHDRAKVKIAVKPKWIWSSVISFVLVSKFLLVCRVSLRLPLLHKSPKNVLLMDLIHGRVSMYCAPWRSALNMCCLYLSSTHCYDCYMELPVLTRWRCCFQPCVWGFMLVPFIIFPYRVSFDITFMLLLNVQLCNGSVLSNYTPV